MIDIVFFLFVTVDSSRLTKKNTDLRDEKLELSSVIPRITDRSQFPSHKKKL